jgi:hypothetical protein
MRISITAQIEEVEREIALRERVYPRQVLSGKMRQSVADMHMDRMKQIAATLQWLRDNEDAVRAAITPPPGDKIYFSIICAGDSCPAEFHTEVTGKWNAMDMRDAGKMATFMPRQMIEMRMMTERWTVRWG